MHEARRSIKALRALLRLVEPRRRDRTEDTIALDRALHDLAEELAPARELRVAARMIGKLRADLDEDDQDLAGFLLRFERDLEAEAAHKEHAGGEARLEASSLGGIETALRSIDWERDADALSTAAARAYRDGRRMIRAGLRGDDADMLHDARRRVVRHQTYTGILGEAAGKRFRRHGKRVSRLRDSLGTHHDFHELAQRLAARSSDEPVARAAGRLVGRRLKRLTAEIEDLADDVFDRKPKRYRERLRSALSDTKAARQDPRQGCRKNPRQGGRTAAVTARRPFRAMSGDA